MTGWEPETLSEFRILTEHATDLVSVLDESGTILYQSSSAEHILGVEPETLIGTDVFQYVHPDDREHVAEKFSGMIRDSEIVTERVEYRFESGDGSWIWLESIGTNRTDTAIDGYVINSRDVTERKAKERHLERRNEQLERFADVVSHDIRNPLSVAEGRLELVRDEYHSEDLDELERALSRIDTLVSDLLALARGGEQLDETRPVTVADLVAECWSTVETAAATLESSVDHTIRADETRLAQLFENLFRNAVEHGGDDVTVTVGELEDGFYVADDGPGIPEDERDSVFESGHTSAPGNTGLGLSIVREVVEAHGWAVAIDESATGGARFEITGVERVDATGHGGPT